MAFLALTVCSVVVVVYYAKVYENVDPQYDSSLIFYPIKNMLLSLSRPYNIMFCSCIIVGSDVQALLTDRRYWH